MDAHDTCTFELTVLGADYNLTVWRKFVATGSIMQYTAQLQAPHSTCTTWQWHSWCSTCYQSASVIPVMLIGRMIWNNDTCTHEHISIQMCMHTHTQRHANKQVGTCTYEVKSYAILYTLIQIRSRSMQLPTSQYYDQV